MSTTVTVRPTTLTVTNGGWTGAVGTLADNSDATGVQNNLGSANSDFRLNFAAPTIPAGAQILAVTPRLRATTGGTSAGMRFSLFDGSLLGPDTNIPSNAGTVTYTGTASAATPSGLAWTSALVNSIQMYVYAPDANAASVAVEAYLDVVYNAAPTATATGPNGSSQTSEPTFTWTYSDPDGDAQERYRIKVFSASQYNASGFDPNTSTPTVDTGEVFSNATGWACTTALASGVTYRAYIFVADAGSGGRYNIVTASGPYAYATISVNTAAIPALTVTPDTANSRVLLTATSLDNQLSYNAASAEVDLSGIAAQANCTLSRTTANTPAPIPDGTYAVRMTAASAASMNACFGTNSGATAGITPVVAGQAYSAYALVRTNATQRSVIVSIRFFTSAGAFISQTAGPTGKEPTSFNWGQMICPNVTAPANAAFADVLVQIVSPANAEAHDVDTVALVPTANINLLRNPTFGKDANNDGTPDFWSVYNFGSDPGFAVSIVPTTTPVFNTTVTPVAGDQTAGLSVSSNTGWKGVSQVVSMVPGQTYTVSCWVYTFTSTSWQLYVDQFTTTGAGQIASVTPTPGVWTLLSLTGVADVYGATSQCTIYIRSANSGSFAANLSLAQVVPGSINPATVLVPNSWTRGGTAVAPYGLVQYVFERSIDNGVTWKALRQITNVTYGWQMNVGLPETAQFYEYEAPIGVPVLYRVSATTSDLSTPTVSEHSAYVSATLAWDGKSWIKDPMAPTRNISVVLDQHSLVLTREESQGIHYAMGRADPIVIHGTIRTATFPLALFFTNDAQYKLWRTLQDSQRTLLLQTPYGDSGAVARYFTIDTPVQTEELTIDSMRTAQPRRVSVTARETVAP